MKDFSYYLESLNEFGTVTQVNHPIIVANGLPKAKLHEIVLFETGQQGEVFSLNPGSLEILLLSQERVQVGTRLTRTNKTLSVTLGNELLGHTINPLGIDIDTPIPTETFKEERPIDIKPLGIAHRVRITRPFQTGTSIIDMLTPLGKGQKELIIGDRKTGKSSFLFTTMKKQITSGALAIYATIGKKKSDIKHLQDLLEKEKLASRAIIVATNSSDSPSLIYLTPFTAITIAEYFRDQGEDVLLILDDLTTHARFYREISLLLKNFPGRDSYPGDIFYTNARLLERAGNFTHPTKGEVAITCFPIVETVEGDLTNYIVTTLMGITDGHIFFDSNIFYKGNRPAVNTSLSVTRVGKQTQSNVQRSITRELSSFLTLYDKMLNLSHFGAELTDNVKNILAMGEKISLFFEQNYTDIIPSEVQLILFSLLWIQLIDPDKTMLKAIQQTLLTEYTNNQEVQQLCNEIVQVNTFNELLRNVSLQKERIFAIWKKNTN
jgi:F-type H+-transporting ATPase subunit alpha